MANLSEKDIDKIFREGSKKHEFPFKESAWNNMEAMLDEQDRKRKFGYLTKALLGLVVFAFVIYVLLPENSIEANQDKVEISESLSKSNPSNEAREEFSNSNTIETSNSHKTNQSKYNSLGNDRNEQSNKSTSNVEINEASKATELIDIKDNNNSVDATRDNKTSLKTINNRKTNVQTNISKNQNLDTNRANKNQKIISPKPSNSSLNDNKIIANSIIKNNIEKSSSIVPLSKDIEEDKSEDSRDKTTGINNSIAIAPSIPLIGLKYIEREQDEKFPLNEISKINGKSRFSFGLLVGLEWTTADMNRSLKRGYRLGANVSYRINNKFLVTSGLTFSRKTYLTEGENYKPLKKWDQGIVPETVDGTCNIFEIPVELSYFLAGNNRNSFYISAGISTFIMDKEWYGFSFTDPTHETDPNIRKRENNLEVDKKALHYFGIGTLAIGYQRRINKNTLLQLEPYFQLPFDGIGIGQVNLISTGFQVKVSFNR